MATHNLLPPQMFDLSTDIAEYVPPEIINEWAASDQSLATARKILKPNLVKGTIVSTDTSGLSKLSQNMGLVEVLALISKPKEIIFKLGKELGGQGVGIWAADNTEMFYDSSIDPDAILQMLMEVQAIIAQECQVKIGIGVHYGYFYNIGNGLYGVEADFIEQVAEDEAHGGETLLSQAFWDEIKNKGDYQLTKRDDLDGKLQTVYTATETKSRMVRPFDFSEPAMYPIPYSQEFYFDIRSLPDTQTAQAVYQKYAIPNKVVVLISRAREEGQRPEITLLNDLYYYGLMSRVSLRLLSEFEGKKVKVISNLGIYLFSTPLEAYGFARAFHRELDRYQIGCKTGIAQGDIVLFDLPNGRKDIAGGPVNLASKMAEDAGELGRIYLQKPLDQHVVIANKTEGTLELSGIEIDYVEVSWD